MGQPQGAVARMVTGPAAARQSRGNVDPAFWAGKRVFLTGHTGFKGSWLSLWLQQMGAQVTGFALAPPTDPALFEVARVADGMTSIIGDIRDRETLARTLVEADPEIVIHMAAQPLVRASYDDPVGTYATNVMGTVHLLEAIRQAPGVRAACIVTTDKCYENREWAWGYREDEPMGGYDPYSNSKGCAELVTSAYRRSFFGGGSRTAIASGRAGNVIGGGDWALDRLIPDILRAIGEGEPVLIRNPLAIRPWQHVLEPLSGYLVLCQALWNDPQTAAEAWNFGPRDEDARPVQWIVERLCDLWSRAGGGDAAWTHDQSVQPHEAHYLKLDISKARAQLGWQPRWTLAEALDNIVAWQRAWASGADMHAYCFDELERFQGANQSLAA